MTPAPEPGQRPGAGPRSAPPTERELARAVDLLRAVLGVDLNGYQPNVMLRRLQARVRDTGSPAVAEYLARLEGGDAAAVQEARNLRASFSVRVSSFFRDPAVFAALERQVFPALMARGGELRVWSAGCSRGQEVYSLAHSLYRAAGGGAGAAGFAVLGTDVDAGALRQARLGVYSTQGLEAVPAAVRRAAFEPVAEHRWQVRPHLRQRVRFEVADLRDPATHPTPGRFDLVACRNLLIYLDRPAQEEIILALRRSLRPGGYLLLGASETVLGRPWRLLEHVDPALRLYRRPA